MANLFGRNSDGSRKTDQTAAKPLGGGTARNPFERALDHLEDPRAIARVADGVSDRVTANAVDPHKVAIVDAWLEEQAVAPPCLGQPEERAGWLKALRRQP